MHNKMKQQKDVLRPSNTNHQQIQRQTTISVLALIEKCTKVLNVLTTLRISNISLEVPTYVDKCL